MFLYVPHVDFPATEARAVVQAHTGPWASAGPWVPETAASPPPQLTERKPPWPTGDWLPALSGRQDPTVPRHAATAGGGGTVLALAAPRWGVDTQLAMEPVPVSAAPVTPPPAPQAARPTGPRWGIDDTLQRTPQAAPAPEQPLAMGVADAEALTGSEALSPSSIADTFQIGFTAELSTLLADVQVTGDATRSFEEEDRYYQENLTIRGVGSYGYESEGQLLVSLMATNSSKLYEPSWLIDTLNIAALGERYTLDLWNILPKFTDYSITSKKLQGLKLETQHKKTKSSIVYGKDAQLEKAIGIIRSHAAIQLSRATPEKKRNMSVQVVRTYDDEPIRFPDPTVRNTVMTFKADGESKQFYRWDTEYARSMSNGLGNGDAYILKLDKKKANYLAKASYEYVDLFFDTLGASATPGKKETRLSFKYAFSKLLDVTLGYKDRDFFNNRTEEVPLVVNYKPPVNRSNLKLSWKFTDKVLASTTDKLNITLNEWEAQDTIGINKVKVSYKDETRDKLTSANQDKRQFEASTNTVFSEKWSLKTKYKRFSQKTLSRFKDYNVNIGYSPMEWHDMSLQYALKDTQGAASDKESWTFTYTHLDIFNDREYAFKFKRDNFREFTVNRFEFKLGLVY